MIFENEAIYSLSKYSGKHYGILFSKFSSAKYDNNGNIEFHPSNVGRFPPSICLDLLNEKKLSQQSKILTLQKSHLALLE